MDSSRLARDPYARRQAPPMAPPTSLSSGQGYYTVESLEGASSLPLLKPGFTPPASLASERDALLRLDVHTRALLADRETLDVRARALAAEREALLRRNVSGAPLTDQRAYADGLPPVDARSRLDGLPLADASTRLSLDELRALGLYPGDFGFDSRSQDASRPGFSDRARARAPGGGRALGVQDPRSFSEVNRPRDQELAGASFPPRRNHLRDVRDIAAPRASVLPLRSSVNRRETSIRPIASSFQPQSKRPFAGGTQRTTVPHPAPVEAGRKQSKSVAGVKTPPEKPKSKVPAEQPKSKVPAEQSEGWCAVCKVDCHTIKTLNEHLKGKKHKAMIEEGPTKMNEGKSTPAVIIKTDRKRASDAKPEPSQSAKRPKTSALPLGNNAPTAEAKKSKGDDPKKKKVKVPAAKNGKDKDLKKETVKASADKNSKDNSTMPVCKICNIFTTGQKNLETHLKGKRHAARLKELAES